MPRATERWFSRGRPPRRTRTSSRPVDERPRSPESVHPRGDDARANLCVDAMFCRIPSPRATYVVDVSRCRRPRRAFTTPRRRSRRCPPPPWSARAGAAGVRSTPRDPRRQASRIPLGFKRELRVMLGVFGDGQLIATPIRPGMVPRGAAVSSCERRRPTARNARRGYRRRARRGRHEVASTVGGVSTSTSSATPDARGRRRSLVPLRRHLLRGSTRRRAPLASVCRRMLRVIPRPRP